MLSQCFLFGVNHHTVQTELRGQYSISPVNKELFYQKAAETNIKSLAIINTCNRTEIYGVGDAKQAIDLYCSINNLGTELRGNIFIKQDKQAIEHLFHVASGLDSKVIGDLEILGQVKDAFHQSKKHGMLNGYMERVANNCVQAAKEVRSSTQLSNGTTSLAYSIVKYFKEIKINENPKILIIGAGNFSKRIGQNVMDYMPSASLDITNRTASKAMELAGNLGANSIEYSTWKSQLSQYDIVISAVSAPEKYLIDPTDVTNLPATYFLDMSVPYSFNPQIREHLNERHLTIDELAPIVNNSIESRKSDIPVAESILEKNLQLFYEWNEFTQNSESLKNWKNVLIEKVNKCPFLSQLPQETVDHYVKKSMGQFALYIRNHHHSPEDTTTMLNAFLAIYHKAEMTELLTVNA